jgi:DHA3 family macrolide efflux protein-like MFS transporter
MRRTQPAGMFGFAIVWIGQTISLLGSSMSWFAFMIWAWEETGQATALALVGFFSFGPALLLSPVAGALVDRWNRKLVMMLSDLAAGLCTLIALVLYATGNLEIWHLYLIGAFAGVFQAFQFPAYSASITMMLPKEHYARAEGMVGLGRSLAGVLAPIVASLLLGIIGMAGIMAIDVVTFVIAVSALLFVSVPQPPRSVAGSEAQGSLLKESLYGFRYIIKRPSLLGLQLVFTAGNLLDYAGYVLFAPMILARTGDNATVLGTVQSAGAIGGIVGGLLLAVWGGPRRRIHGVLVGWALSGVLGMSLMGLGQGLFIWVVASFFYTFFAPVVNSSEQAIWQSKVAPDVQGRVFAVQDFFSNLAVPVAMVAVGPLADRVFEPAMASGGRLAPMCSWLVGTGLGAGMALMIVLLGFLEVVVGLSGYLSRTVRDVEDILPDYDAQLCCSGSVVS